MPIELRSKRKVDTAASPPPPAKRKASLSEKDTEAIPEENGTAKGKNPVEEKKPAEEVKKPAEEKKSLQTLKAGSFSITDLPEWKVNDSAKIADLDAKVKTHDSEEVKFTELVEKAEKAIIIFTYPTANTGGCTKQAGLFNGIHDSLTKGGIGLYGLSGSSVEKNAQWKKKQGYTYTLLSDPELALAGKLGLKNSNGKIQRGVWIYIKEGDVIAHMPGSPDGTYEAILRVFFTDGSEDADATDDQKEDDDATIDLSKSASPEVPVEDEEATEKEPEEKDSEKKEDPEKKEDSEEKEDSEKKTEEKDADSKETEKTEPEKPADDEKPEAEPKDAPATDSATKEE